MTPRLTTHTTSLGNSPTLEPYRCRSLASRTVSSTPGFWTLPVVPRVRVSPRAGAIKGGMFPQLNDAESSPAAQDRATGTKFGSLMRALDTMRRPLCQGSFDKSTVRAA